jgi:hypothetical protein
MRYYQQSLGGGGGVLHRSAPSGVGPHYPVSLPKHQLVISPLRRAGTTTCQEDHLQGALLERLVANDIAGWRCVRLQQGPTTMFPTINAQMLSPKSIGY